MTNYLILEQLAANMRRAGMTTTAELASREAELLEAQFDELTDWRVDPRTVPVWLDQFVNSLRQRVVYHEQCGNLAEQLAALLAISVLAHAHEQKVPLTQDATRKISGRTQYAAASAFERINQNRSAEYNAARCSAALQVKADARAAFAEQKRQQQVSQLEGVKRQLEAALRE
jgi:hypothetical protein